MEIEGISSIEIAMPKYLDSYDYLNGINDATNVLLFGYNPKRNFIELIGVGEVRGKKVFSIGKLDLNTISYLGYEFPIASHKEIIRKYIDNELSIFELRQKVEE